MWATVHCIYARVVASVACETFERWILSIASAVRAGNPKSPNLENVMKNTVATGNQLSAK